MKKTLLLVLSLLLIVGVALGLAGCKPKNEEPPVVKSYTLDSSAFKPTAVFGEKLSLNGLKLVEAGGETVTVTDSMVTGADTSSAGEKTLTISYNDQTFTVKYTVKFRVVFVVNGVETEQLVVNASEINVPTPPAVTGQQFESWSVDIPTTLTSNLRIDAIYKTLDGSRGDVYTWTGNGIINLSGYVTDVSKVNVAVTDADGNAIGSDVATVALEGDKIKYSLLSDASIIILISGDGVMDKSWLVQKTEEPTASLANGEAIGVTVGGKNISQKINVSQTPVSFRYTAIAGNANIEVGASGGFVIIYPADAKAGVTEITVKVTNSENELESITLKQYVVVTPSAISITNNATEYGIEDIWTVGRENAGGLQKFAISVTGTVGEGFYENISWTTGNSNVTVSKDGTISLANVSADPDVISVKAVFSYKGVELVSAPMKVRCVYTGVNVYNYNELWAETNSVNPRPIVLQGDIKNDFSATNYNTMQSTYDLKYYENLYGVGTTEFYNATQIKVLIQFKNDVYGNGYEINAHNATLGTLDATGKPTDRSLFKGPLNFVAMAQTGGAISVKGQDNIVFGVYEGVTINNIILKSCDLTAVDGKVDLNDLEYAGTTVEVLGDNVTIEYSRLQNGRMVLRVFGDDNDANQEIHLEIKNTVLKGSREFIARIGSNRFEYNADVAAPYLPGDSETTKDYNTKKVYDKMTEEEKAAYDEKYINTFVTFENVVFEDAGIFSIGLDAHFAGEALKDGSRWFSGALVGWKDLAKTSYGAKITLKTDVRLYSWKPLEDIDSSTLMENTLSKEGTGDNSMFANMKFDVKALVKSAASTNAQYSNILYNYGGADYVHAGIAFFGGGKNYSIVENKITSTFNHTFTEYNVKLSELVDDKGQNQGYLQTAAGNEPFYFLIYNKNSTFTYETQLNMADKYSCLYN